MPLGFLQARAAVLSFRYRRPVSHRSAESLADRLPVLRLQAITGDYIWIASLELSWPYSTPRVIWCAHQANVGTS
jgi:hypothetical protein